MIDPRKVNTMSVAAPVETSQSTIRRAVEWARARGIVVRPGSYGVTCTGASGWHLDTREDGCCPLGAIVLMLQPLTRSLPEAPAFALGVQIAWVEGFNAGVDRDDNTSSWLMTARRQLFLDGYGAGVLCRMNLQSVEKE